MSLFYISRNYKSSNNAASKPKTDCEVVMAKNGFKNLGFKQTTHASSAIGAIISFFGITKGLLWLPRKSVLAMQYPLSKFYGYVTNVARIKGCKVILIVHDVKTLMGKTKNIKKEMQKFSKADVLIVHNDEMKKWFITNGYNGKIVPLYLFDYMSFDTSLETGLIKKNEKYEIVFAGGLGKEKSAFIYEMDNFKNRNFALKLYGNGFQKNEVNSENSVIKYQGVFSPDEVVKKIKGNFGLVWNGNSLEECAGDFGKYLLYNNPHKTSLYILCGLPILVWKKAAIAKFITSNKLGIAINTLEEVDEKLRNLSTEEYKEMTDNVAETREKIMDGGFLSKALKKALQMV
ncbi:beta-1,6-galactofuranosyltransferase [uncultured Maribacter sp.]|uniref:beta-1,6-galactofuranosyltransferase n=1 Tax=uncultured Maribacter sp. TaxID=431308 RepID=UPI00260A2255|nr:beta-1,6-galactofuranosyltransferase [uncultured Maribacter sp.]